MDIYILKQDNKGTGLAVYSQIEADRFVKDGEYRSYEKISVYNNYQVGEAFQERLIDGEIRILPAPRSGTSAKSGIYIHRKNKTAYNHSNHPNTKMHHMYLINDDEICDGDLYFNLDNNKISNSFPELANNAPSCKKIVAATDTKLGVPAVGRQFVKEFVDVKCNIKNVQFKIVKIKPMSRGNLLHVALVYKK